MTTSFAAFLRLLLVGWVVAGWARGAERLDFVGTVEDPEGKPVPGATVFLHAARPRKGPAYQCPSCYPDCGKYGRTGADGRFRIESVDGALLFRVVVVADGYEPGFFKDVDAARGPWRGVLSRSRQPVPSEHLVRGRVVDSRGDPVAFAIVEVQTYTQGSLVTGGVPAGADAVAVTDEAGWFELRMPPPVTSVSLRIEAQARAPLVVENVAPGGTEKKFVLTEGVSITGRVVRNGRPVPDVLVGAMSADRTYRTQAGGHEVATGSDGRFLLVNLAPNLEYHVYGRLSSLTNLGVLPIRRGNPGGDGAVWDLGDWQIQPGNRLAGRVRLSDGKSIPAQTLLVIDREDAWDTLAIELPSDGRFEIPNLPPDEPLSVRVALDGYHLARSNGSLDWLNPWRLIGRLPEDKRDLTILLELGDRKAASADPDLYQDLQDARPAHLPLCGAERALLLPVGWEIEGTVRDADTGEPIADFEVLPATALTLRGEDLAWHRRRLVQGRNGHYRVGLPPATTRAVVEVRAPGYLPARSPVLHKGRARWDCELRKGRRPAGVVLDDRARPVKGAVVWCLAPGDRGMVSWEELTLRVGAGVSRAVTDEQGRFELEPRNGDWCLIVLDEAGFACVDRADAGSNVVVRLRPWARVQGRVVGPADYEGAVFVWIRRTGTWERLENGGFGAPLIVPDRSGRFEMKRFPPGPAIVQVSIPTKLPNPPMEILEQVFQRRLDLPPGAVVDLGEMRWEMPNSHQTHDR